MIQSNEPKGGIHLSNTKEVKAIVYSDRRIAKTKRAIKCSLASIMRTKELNRITITEISQKANINRKTFYKHYDSVIEVYNEILKEMGEMFVAGQEKYHTEKGYKWKAFICEVLNYFYNDVLFFQDLANSIEVQDIILAAYKFCVETRMNYIACSNDQTSSILMIQRQFIAGFIFNIYEWLISGVKLNPKEMTDFFYQAFFLGRNSFDMKDEVIESE
jgi:AcrR family transcriptional regulator